MARVFQDAKQLRRLGKRECPWTVEWYEGAKRRSKTIGRKALADKFATVKQAELVQRQTDMAIDKTWAEFVQDWHYLHAVPIMPKLEQEQMGHASFVTTQRYVRYAEAHRDKSYDVYLPAGVALVAGSR